MVFNPPQAGGEAAVLSGTHRVTHPHIVWHRTGYWMVFPEEEIALHLWGDCPAAEADFHRPTLDRMFESVVLNP